MTDARRFRWPTLAFLLLAGSFCIRGFAEVIYESSPVVDGRLVTSTTFSVPGAGTVTAVLSDMGWPEPLASLTFAATTPSTVLASMSGAGDISFKVGGPGIYSAVVGAVASPNSLLDLGWYSMTIAFTPAVPLPGSAWLLLCGLGALALTLRRVRVCSWAMH